MLSLMEELLLLAVNEEKGTILLTASSRIDYCLIGALLMELELQKRIKVNKKSLEVLNRTPTQNPRLDTALKQIDSSKRLKSPEYWIRKLRGTMKHLRKELLEELADKALVREENRQFLIFFNRTCYPLRDIRAKKDIQDRLQKILLRGEAPHPRTLKLLALVHTCNLVKTLVDKEERKEAGKLSKALSREDLIAQSIKKVIQASTKNTGSF